MQVIFYIAESFTKKGMFTLEAQVGQECEVIRLAISLAVLQ